MKKRTIWVLCLILLMVSCSRNPVTPAPQASSTAAVPVSQVETPTAAPTSTATPTPTPTATPEPTATPTLTPTATPEPRGYGPDDFPENINPLTGLEPADPSLLDRRPIGVKVNIVPRYVRPPWGLSLADIVYDYYHNDGYARYHAIFYGQDAELVGPVRSGRLLDDALIRMYKSAFAFGNADPIIRSRIFNSPYANRVFMEGKQANCPPTLDNPFCRFDPGGQQLLLVDTSLIGELMAKQKIDNSRQNLNGMTFHPRVPEDGQPGTDLLVRFSIDNYSRWEYDPESGRYLLFQDNLFLDQGQAEQFLPLIDRLSEEQIAADNVVILLATHEYVQRPPADIIEIYLNGSGPAYAFRDGEMFELRWNRPAVDSVLYLTYPDGTPYAYRPGTTWYQVLGQYSEVSKAKEGTWRFIFRFP
jgi:hypothetical protein